MDYELLREHLVITTVVLAIQDVIRAEIIAFFLSSMAVTVF